MTTRGKLFQSLSQIEIYDYNIDELKLLHGNGEFIPIRINHPPIGITLWYDGDGRRAFIVDIKRKKLREDGLKIGDFILKIGKYTVYDAKHEQILNCIRYFIKRPPIYIMFFRVKSV